MKDKLWEHKARQPFFARHQSRNVKGRKRSLIHEMCYRFLIFWYMTIIFPFRLPLTETIVLIYLDGQKIVFIYNELMLSFQVVHFLLQLPVSLLFILPFMLLHDKLGLLLLQLLVCKCTTLFTRTLTETW